MARKKRKSNRGDTQANLIPPVKQAVEKDVVSTGLPEPTEIMLFGAPLEEVTKAKFDPNNPLTRGEQQQQDQNSQSGTGGDVIEPPINFSVWALMLEINTRLNRAIQLRARNTVGLGFSLQTKIDLPSGATKAKAKEQLDKIKKLFDCPNDEIPLTTLLYLMKLDQETIGNGYIEVVRNRFNKITGLNHLTGSTIKVRKNRRGFVQQRGMSKVYYKIFKDQRSMDYKTGRFARTRTIPADREATELLHFKLYSSSRSSFYGLPRWLSAAKAVTGNDLAAKRNVVFFENDAVPRMAVLVEGGNLDATSVKAIQDFVTHQKGVDNAHRVMVLQGVQKKLGLTDQSKTKITLEPLSVGVTEDASFLKYRSANDDEVREAFGISEAFFSMDQVNRAAADVGRQITNEQEFEPDRVDLEFFINHTLIRETLGLSEQEDVLIEFKFNRPEITNPVDRVKMDTLLSDSAVLTTNEMRGRMKLPPYPSKFKFGDLPLPVALNLLKQGLTTLIDDESIINLDPNEGSDDSESDDDSSPNGPENRGRPNDNETTGNSGRSKRTAQGRTNARSAGASSGRVKTPQPRKGLTTLQEQVEDLEKMVKFWKNQVVDSFDETEDTSVDE